MIAFLTFATVSCQQAKRLTLAGSFALTSLPTITPVTPVIAVPEAAPSPTPGLSLSLWVDPALPVHLVDQLAFPGGIMRIVNASQADLRLELTQPEGSQEPVIDTIRWVYALVAPFPTVEDEVGFNDLMAAWKGQPTGIFTGRVIYVDVGTRAVLSAHWGDPAGEMVRELPVDQILKIAWNEKTSWAIIPFEQLEPRWKVLAVDGMSPVRKQFEPASYPLAFDFVLQAKPEAEAKYQAMIQSSPDQFHLPRSNRDSGRLSVVVMTGTTALVRAIAYKMDLNGITYPDGDIRDWLTGADITHISNEVSFNPDCLPGNPYDSSLRFCSRPEYFGLLEDVGMDVVELTGNHENDRGTDAMRYSLDLYRQKNILYFGGGENLEDAQKPALITDHGNRFAFIGCNQPGPDFAWATETQPGAAPCGDYAWILQKIASLKSEGYLPIVTQQYAEGYSYAPLPYQERDFRSLADAGAIIVSGSQAHFPMTKEIYNGSFIDYGLGNLFFDQMDIPVPGTRREFIDRHVFYDGKYISTELLTAMLEDYSRPRPMTPDERRDLLTTIFQAGGW